MRYEKFQNKGISLQRSARTIDEAVNRFAYSCDCCATQGKSLRCQMCGIDEAHRARIDELKGDEDERNQN